MYEGVKPTTNRNVDPTKFEKARPIPLTDSELEVLAMALGLSAAQMTKKIRMIAEGLSVRLRAEISR